MPNTFMANEFNVLVPQRATVAGCRCDSNARGQAIINADCQMALLESHLASGIAYTMVGNIINETLAGGVNK